MKFFFCLLIGPIGFLLSCTGRASATSSSELTSAAASNNSIDSTYYGKNSLTYNVEGRHVAIKDALKTGERKYTTVLYVNKASNKAGTVNIQVTNLLTNEVFDLTFPANGTSGTGSYLGTHSLNNFYCNTVTIRVTSLTATNVAANFSGTFTVRDQKQAPVNIQDGSFDLQLKNE